MRRRHVLLEIAVPDDRPKCNVAHPVKWPEELLDDLEAYGRMYNPPKSLGDVIKDCCEFRLTLIKGLHLGYYHLRTVPERIPAQPGTTSADLVAPKGGR